MHKIDKTIDVLYCFDEDYEPYAATSIVSLLINSNEDNFIRLHLFCNLTENLRSFLKSLKKKYKFFFKIYNLSNEDLDILKQFPNPVISVSKIAWTRIFAPKYIDNNIEKIIYLDSDTIILKDITEMIDISLGKNFLGAVLDYSNPKMSTYHKIKNYFNSGVLILNLKLLRRKNLIQELINFILLNYKQLKLGDQCALNLFFKDQIKKIDNIYNKFIISNESPQQNFNTTDKIIHFVTSAKPWKSYSLELYKNIFLEYSKLTTYNLKIQSPKNMYEDWQMAIHLSKYNDESKILNSIKIYENILNYMFKTYPYDNNIMSFFELYSNSKIYLETNNLKKIDNYEYILSNIFKVNEEY